MSEELGWSLEDFDKAFQEVFQQGMVKADFDSRVVWIPNAIKHNRPESPNVVISWGKEIDLIPECALKDEAIMMLFNHIELIDSESDKPEKRSYSTAFEKAFGKATAKPFKKPMPNQEQEQEQEQEQDQNTLVHGEKTASEPGPEFSVADFTDYPEADLTQGSEADSDAAGKSAQKKPQPHYPPDFEQAWQEYPRRAGANPKRAGFSAWRARRREGVSPDVMLEGVRRYVNFLQATGKAGTEFVQRASTFFGPDRNFENPWSSPAVGGGERSIHQISPPETTIPDGFRGA